MKKTIILLLVLFISCKKSEIEKPKENILFSTREEALKSFKETKKEIIHSLRQTKDLKSIEIYISMDFYIKDHYIDRECEYKGSFNNLLNCEIDYDKLLFVLEYGTVDIYTEGIPSFIEILYEKQMTKNKLPRIRVRPVNREWKLYSISYTPGVE